MALKLLGIGGMGLMLSPAAKHLQQENSPARFIRIHDRGTRSEHHEQCRQAWQAHGAELAGNFADLVKADDYDGIVICAGKNGDDSAILRELVPLIQTPPEAKHPPFILHLSTVSAGFAQAAHDYLRTVNIAYMNCPLTGGPVGAANATMLILAGGNRALYERLEPALKALGRPNYLGDSVTAGAEVKLMGQLMVFNGLTGISSAAALKAACFQESLSGEAQAAFFDFLNGGAGGTRQWEVALSHGIRDDVWHQGFMVQHAVVDAIYAAQLCQERGLPGFVIMPMVSIALAFAYLLRKYPQERLATHAIVRELVQAHAAELDGFMSQRIHYADVGASIRNCIQALPEQVQKTVLADVGIQDFGQAH